MTKRTSAIAIAAVGGALVLLSGGGAATTSGPAMPTNLEVVAVTETSITLAWGPSQPGPFTNLGEPKKNQLLVGWGPSQDSRSAVTYTFVKDGATVASGLTKPQYLVTGLNPKTKSFRVCVTARNAKGQSSPQTCGTFSKIA